MKSRAFMSTRALLPPSLKKPWAVSSRPTPGRVVFAVALVFLVSNVTAWGSQSKDSVNNKSITLLNESDKVNVLKRRIRNHKLLSRFVEVLPNEYRSIVLRRLSRDDDDEATAQELLSVALGNGAPVINGEEVDVGSIPSEVRAPLQFLHAEQYHKYLWKWHHDNFFAFEDHLLAEEIRYIAACFRYAGEEHYDQHLKGSHRLSYFSYSHKVEGNRVDSSRFAIGLVKNPQLIESLAKEVLRVRGVDVGMFGSYSGDVFEDENLIFGGLGWDINEGHLKLYMRVRDIYGLPKEVKNALVDYDTAAYSLQSSSGIISWSFSVDKETGTVDRAMPLHEEKIYKMAQAPSPLQSSELVNVTVMSTSKRGDVFQHDIRSPERLIARDAGGNPRAGRNRSNEQEDIGYIQHLRYWKEKINALGLSIIYLYAKYGEEPLDTISFQDKNHFTLYFP